jgi:hypothetical protein
MPSTRIRCQLAHVPCHPPKVHDKERDWTDERRADGGQQDFPESTNNSMSQSKCTIRSMCQSQERSSQRSRMHGAWANGRRQAPATTVHTKAHQRAAGHIIPRGPCPTHTHIFICVAGTSWYNVSGGPFVCFGVYRRGWCLSSPVCPSTVQSTPLTIAFLALARALDLTHLL